MKLIDLEHRLLTLKQPVLQTSDVAALLKISQTHASKILDRLSKAGSFVKLMRGRWATASSVDPLILPEYLTAPAPSYISLQTALFYHGMISQIPSTIYAVTLARTHQCRTSLGNFSFHYIQPDFFFGFEWYGAGNIKMATPEKALLDLFYLTPARSRLFASLPEVELPETFSTKKIQKMVKKIYSPQRRALVLKRLAFLGI